LETPVIKKDFIAVLIFFFTILSFSRYALAEIISLNEYETRIQEAIHYCESSEKGRLREIRTRLLKLFPPELIVQKSDEEILPIDTRGMLSQLGEPSLEENGLKNLKANLNMLFQHVKSTADDQMMGLDWEESRRHLRQIYLKKEFKGLREKKTPFWVEYLERFSNILRDWFYKNMGKIVDLSSGMGNTLLYIICGLIMLLGGIIIFWISKSFGWFGWQSRDKKVSLKKMEAMKIPEWDSWRKDALEMASKGEFREAIRSLFLSVLMKGHIKGWWVYEPKATNREHLERMKGPAIRLKALKSLVGIYEKAWYGLGNPGKEEFQKCNEIVQLIETSS
jgi:hypothetical protein